MKIINGKWQDVNEDPVDNFNVSQLLEIGKNATVIELNAAYPKYARVAVTNKKGIRKEPHYPTHLIKEQLEARDREEERKQENKSVDDILIEMKQLISQI